MGSFPRRRPTVGDIDILATASDPGTAMERFCSHDDVTAVLSRGETKSSVVVSGDLQMDLRIVDGTEYGSALVYFTGSKDHNAQPQRLDLDWASVKEYRETARYVVSTDAHTTGELDFMHLGVAQARRGWCEACNVLNTRSLYDLLPFFE